MAAYPNLSQAQVSCTYAGGTNNWTTLAAWNTCSGFFPNNGNGGNNFNVTITSGLVTLDQNITLNNFTQSDGQVAGINNLTITGVAAITLGGHSGAGTTTVQGTTTISGSGLSLDGGRILRNEGTVTQTNANVDMNSRRSGAIEAGNGTVVNAAGGTWNSNATVSASNFILASSQGVGDTGAGAVFTNQGTLQQANYR